MDAAEFKPLLAIAESYIHDALPSVMHGVFTDLKQIMEHYLSGVLTTERASAIFLDTAGTSRPVERIAAILGVPDNPISPPSLSESSTLDRTATRKKIHPWSEYEDQRLLCAIHKYGLDNWITVSEFVGNHRTRAQCSQRWFRGLDPRISKVLWTPQEEERLLQLVSLFGDRAWTRVSAELGNRSDAQCRYHYKHMTKSGARKDGIKSSSSEPGKVMNMHVAGITGSNSLGTPKKPLPPIADILRGETVLPMPDVKDK
jgi:hypothetical protein